MGRDYVRVYAIIPKAGLGNKLFVWARAVVFSKLNGTSYLCWGWSHFSIGPYLRGERVKRNYKNIIKGKQASGVDKISFWFNYVFNKRLIVFEPPVVKQELKDGMTVVFSVIPHWSDYFKYLKNYRSELRNEIFNITTPEINAIFNSNEPPFFSVHIRLGDFKKLKEGEDFKKVGNTRTPLDYFIDGIVNVRQVIGTNIPVSIFTDGRDDELAPVLALENVKIIKGNPDLADILLMSKSKIIMTSASSTFGYWAAFLSEAIVLMHPDHIHSSLRDDETNARLYEGPLYSEVNNWSSLLISNLKDLNN